MGVERVCHINYAWKDSLVSMEFMLPAAAICALIGMVTNPEPDVSSNA